MTTSVESSGKSKLRRRRLEAAPDVGEAELRAKTGVLFNADSTDQGLATMFYSAGCNATLNPR
jgi:hypothetical protein